MRGPRGFLFGLTVDEIKAVAQEAKPGTSIWTGCFDLEPSVEVLSKESGQPFLVRRIGVEGFRAGCVMMEGSNHWHQAWDFKLPKKSKAQLTKA